MTTIRGISPKRRFFTTKAIVIPPGGEPFHVTVKIYDLDALDLNHPPAVISGRITRFDQLGNVQRELDKESLRSNPAAKSRPTMWFGQNRERGYEFQISEPFWFSGSLITKQKDIIQAPKP